MRCMYCQGKYRSFTTYLYNYSLIPMLRININTNDMKIVMWNIHIYIYIYIPDFIEISSIIVTILLT